MLQRINKFPVISDTVDFADFMLSLSFSGQDVAHYRSGAKDIFLFNTPDLVKKIFDDDQTYGVIHHRYKEIQKYYTPGGDLLLNLRGSQRDCAIAYITIQDAINETAPSIERLLAASALAGQPTDVLPIAKNWMLRVMARVLYNFDISDLADEFIDRGNFIEEWLANLENEESWPNRGDIGSTLAQSEKFFNDVAERLASHNLGAREFYSHSDWWRDTLIRTLINAYNAAATALSWILLLLAKDDGRSYQDCLYREAGKVDEPRVLFKDLPATPLSRQIVLEGLRLYPPAWLQGRRALRDHSVNGVRIPEESTVMICAYGLHRNPTYWQDPNNFQPERFRKDGNPRFANAYVPFGGGVHKCPAAGLSVPIIQLMLVRLVRQFRFSVRDNLCRPRGLIGLRPHPGAWLTADLR